VLKKVRENKVNEEIPVVSSNDNSQTTDNTSDVNKTIFDKSISKGVNVCNLCKEEFSVIGTFKKHLKTKHTFKCELCKLVFNRETKLDDHLNLIHDYIGHIEPTRCGMCGDVFTRSSILARHVSSPHLFPCPDCDMKFQTEKSRKKHQCEKKIGSNTQLLNTKSTTNDVINKDIFDPEKLQEKEKFETNNINSKEESSNEYASIKKSIDKIVKEFDEETTTKLSDCKIENRRDCVKTKKQKDATESLGEMALIENPKDLIFIDLFQPTKTKEIGTRVTVIDDNRIDICCTTVLSENAEIEQQKSEPEAEEFFCKLCKEDFPGEKEYFLHNAKAHQEGWKFGNRKQSLKWKKSQAQEEEPEGPFVCQQCSETFKQWSPLLKHLWTPHFFKCEYCPLAFNRNTKLEDHVNATHDLVGLIDSTKCGLCGETFARSSTLARHINSPHNHKCFNCEKSFQTKAVLKKHQLGCAMFHVSSIIEKCLNNISY